MCIRSFRLLLWLQLFYFPTELGNAASPAKEPCLCRTSTPRTAFALDSRLLLSQVADNVANRS